MIRSDYNHSRVKMVTGITSGFWSFFCPFHRNPVSDSHGNWFLFGFGIFFEKLFEQLGTPHPHTFVCVFSLIENAKHMKKNFDSSLYIASSTAIANKKCLKALVNKFNDYQRSSIDGFFVDLEREKLFYRFNSLFNPYIEGILQRS